MREVDASAVHASRAPSSGRSPSRENVHRALMVALIVFGSSLKVAGLVNLSEKRALAEASGAALQSIAGEIRGSIEEEFRALVRFGRGWERGPRPTREEWEAEAGLLVADFDHIQALEWADEAFRIRWIVPVKGNEQAVGLDLAFEERRRSALTQARDRRTAVATRPIELVQGGQGFMLAVPLYSGDAFDGLLLAVYRARHLFESVLRNVVPGYAIRVRDGDTELYDNAEPPCERAREVSIDVGVHNLRWNVAVTAGSDVSRTYITWLPALLIVGGAINAAFFGLAVYLGRTNRWRAQRLLTANERLGAEMRRRAVAEQSQKAAQIELLAVLRSIPDHVWSAHVDADRKFEAGYYSPVVEEISGIPASVFVADHMRWIELVHQADRERVTRAYGACLDGATEKTALEYRILRPDGELRWVRDRVTVTPVEDGLRLDGVITDVTDMKRAEEERIGLEASLRESQKLESLGVLAGGIAHDFNNLLIGVLGGAHLALEDLPEGSPVRPRIRRIERAARAAADLCRQMLAYAGKGTLMPETVDLPEVVEDIGELLGASISKKVALRHAFDEATPPVKADPSQIRQVVMNLITNASEAIGDRDGHIDVSTREVVDPEDGPHAVGRGARLEPGRYAELRVSDDGCGMDQETRRRVFEPFFTRKFTGRGLGMAAVQGIVRAHGGSIRVQSEPDRGTTISVLFPAASAPAAPVRELRRVDPDWRGHGTLLLVDDEEDAREIGTIVLERAGFRVLTADDGVTAVEIFRARRDEVDCVLLDLTMPRMDGVETHRRLRAMRPDLPVILCSGYPEQAAGERFVDEGLAGFLEKPYSPEVLIERVRRVLERAPEPASPDAERRPEVG